MSLKSLKKEKEKCKVKFQLSRSKSHLDMLHTILAHITTEVNDNDQGKMAKLLESIMNAIDTIESQCVILNHNLNSVERTINGFDEKIVDYEKELEGCPYELKMRFQVAINHTSTKRLKIVLDEERELWKQSQQCIINVLITNTIRLISNYCAHINKTNQNESPLSFFNFNILPFIGISGPLSLKMENEDLLVCDSEVDDMVSICDSEQSIISVDENSFCVIDNQQTEENLVAAPKNLADLGHADFGQLSEDGSFNGENICTPKAQKLLGTKIMSIDFFGNNEEEKTPKQFNKRKTNLNIPHPCSSNKKSRRRVRESLIPIMKHTRLIADLRSHDTSSLGPTKSQRTGDEPVVRMTLRKRPQ